MVARLWQSCRPPVWADEEQNRIAQTLFAIQVVLLSGAGVVSGVAWATNQPTVVLGLMVGSAAMIGSWLLSRRGHLQAGNALRRRGMGIVKQRVQRVGGQGRRVVLIEFDQRPAEIGGRRLCGSVGISLELVPA